MQPVQPNLNAELHSTVTGACSAQHNTVTTTEVLPVVLLLLAIVFRVIPVSCRWESASARGR